MANWPDDRALAMLSGVPIDVVEADEEIVVSADLPGMRAEAIDVSIVGSRLTLRGEFRQEEEQRGRNVYVRERRMGKFQRHIDLPASVDVDTAEATPENGVLRVELPKSGGTERSKIDVKRPFEEI